MEESLGRSLAIAAKYVHADLDQRMAEVGSSLYTHIVLRHLEQHPGLTQRELAQRMAIEGPTLTHHLDRLAADGLVERVRGVVDRRTISPVLTAKGRAQLRRSRRVAERANAEMAALFTTSERRTLEGCLHRLTEHYGRVEDDHDRVRHG